MNFPPMADIILEGHGNGLINTYLADQSSIFSQDLLFAISPSLRNANRL